MKLILQPTELKVFIRAINALSKLGHEIYFEWFDNGLHLKTVNVSRSAFASIHFKHIFFDKVLDTSISIQQRFKISGSSCCNVFKFTTSLEKSVIKCKIFLSTEETNLTVQYFCKYGIVKTFNMSIMECEHLEAVYSMEESSNHSLISARLLTEILNKFRQTSGELMLVLKSGECIFQNYIFHSDPSSILTQVPVSATDFEAYVVNCIGEVTFSYKELRIILSFCELVSPLIRIYCDKPGKPVIFACAHETRLSGRFVLATLPFDSQSTTNSQGSQSMLHPSCLVNKTPVQLKSNKEFAQESSMMMENSHSGFQLISKNKDVVVPFGLSATSEMANSDAILTNSKTPTTPQLIESDFNFICKRKSQNSLSSASSFLACDLDDTLLVSPPIKKFRSVLLSHDDDDDDGGCVLNETSDLDGLSENDDRHAVIPNAQVSCPNQFPAMLSRTVLVVDSDGEN